MKDVLLDLFDLEVKYGRKAAENKKNYENTGDVKYLMAAVAYSEMLEDLCRIKTEIA